MTLAAALRAQAQALRAQADALDALAQQSGTEPAASIADHVLVRECGYPLRTVRAAIRERELAGHRVGRDLYVSRAELAAWVERHAAKPRTTNTEAARAARRAIARAAPKLRGIDGGKAQ